MTSAEYRALNQKQPATASKPAAKGKPSTSPQQPRSAHEIAKEQAARLAVLGPARLAYTNTTFGTPLFCRKYQVTDEAQAAALDHAFHRITGTEPA